MAGGCAARRAAEAARQREQAAAATRTAETKARLALLDPPVARGLDVGLDSALLIAQANPGELAAALAPLLTRPTPLDAATTSLWRENGLRVVAVSREQWAGLADRLRISAAAQRQWVAQSPTWIEVVRGPERSGSATSRTIALDSERLELPAGRLRMLARAWITPRPTDSVSSERWASPGVGQVVRPGVQTDASALAVPQLIVELTPQAQDSPRGRNDRISLSMPRSTVDAAQEGLTFWRLQARLRFASSDDLLLILAERPGVDWSEPVTTPPEQDETESAASVPGPGEVVRASARPPGSTPAGPTQSDRDWMNAGPAARPMLTLGEALFGMDGALTSTAPEQSESPDIEQDGRGRTMRQPGRTARAVLLLIPRLPERFELIPG